MPLFITDAANDLHMLNVLGLGDAVELLKEYYLESLPL